MSTSYYKYTCGSTGNQKTFTLSGWFKRGNLGEGTFFGYYSSAGSVPRSEIYINSSNQIVAGLNPTGGSWLELTYPNILRDPAAWYHMVFAYDTTQSEETDRVKVYVNGNQITATSGTYPTLNLDTGFNVSGYDQHIGMYLTGSMIWDGCVAHVNITDGTAYAPTAFGEFDSTSGIWIAKSGPSVTYGTNGGFYKFVAGALTTDSSGAGNTLTSVGTPTPTKDNPDNNFCTISPLDNYLPASTFSNGNTTLVTGAAKYKPNLSTIGMASGKWYWEVKMAARTGAMDTLIGISSTWLESATAEISDKADDWAYYSNGNSRNNSTSTSYGDTYDTGDIIGVALDLDNNKLYFSKNGTFQNSGVPTSGATGTGALSVTTPASTRLGAYFAGQTYWAGGSNTGTFNYNFGNGYFGTTAVTSGNADDAGYGDFEYDVPAGYYALCTNNLGDQS